MIDEGGYTSSSILPIYGMKLYKPYEDLEAVVMGVRRCEPRAQRALYDHLVLRMYNTAFRILKHTEDTQDCLQSGFSLIFNKIDKYDAQKGNIGSWAARIIINESLKLLKKRKVKFELIQDDFNIIDASISPIENLQAEDIFRLLDSLPDQMRIIFNLYEIEGFSHREIAETLNIAESSSRTYLTRAKVKMRALLNKQGDRAKQHHSINLKCKKG